MSMMVSFVLSFFPRDVLDEILNLIKSVSEDFPSYSFIGNKKCETPRISEELFYFQHSFPYLGECVHHHAFPIF